MKKYLLVALMLVCSLSKAQSINDYKAVIVPVKYDWLKQDNQYRLNTLTKFNLEKAGFQVFYNKESIPSSFNDRCNLLYATVLNQSNFLTTKLVVQLKDCNEKVVFESEVGKSKEKEYKVAYTEALNEAFESVLALAYQYSGAAVVAQEIVVAKPVEQMSAPKSSEVVVAPSASTASVTSGADLLYAQATATGFQLIDSTPKVVMKLMKTSQPNSFIAIKGELQGSLLLKDGQWYFEYYKNDVLLSEKVNVKF
ncbi:hypothetical protein KBJ98_12700 [Flavobacterium sp. F-328]|jgi:hypothetical protein|uniref:DUF4468 domain-containing protein n=1 Tax=Flavobacterium erciyesense TaxID=2825842 RepID=A0ABS5D6B6_9FLAO|nr:hypothetical protein [Flavobacterium erciyesense]MBQ0909566.1 hypothetical protein [Flavobacterium erciyesense]